MIATVLSGPLLMRLRRALGDDIDVVVLDSARAVHLANAPHPDAVIVEPLLLAPPPDKSFAHFVARFDRSRIVLYTTSTPHALRATLEFIRLGVARVIIAFVNDSDELIRTHVEGAAHNGPAELLLDSLTSRLGLLRDRSRAVMSDALLHPHQYMNVQALCDAADVPRRSFDRSLSVAGLTSAETLLRGARVVHSYPLLRAGRLTVAAVAGRIGVSERQLSTDIKRFFGLSVRRFSHLTQDRVVSALLYALAPAIDREH